MTSPASPQSDDAEPKLYRFSFGPFKNADVWTDVRALSWCDLAVLLTAHSVGTKDGPCIVPAVFLGTRRRKSEAEQIDVVFLDSDAGATLDEIRAAISARGWAAIISSTHSHLSNQTEVKRGNWDTFRAAGETATAEAYLIQEKGFLPRVAADARVVRETNEIVVLEHQQCPKFRIAIPLARPWMASSYDTRKQAEAAWKAALEALANALSLRHDESCTDPSRLFFLPRRAADSPPAETAVLEGEPCEIFALRPAPERPTGRRSRRKPEGAAADSGPRKRGWRDQEEPLSVHDPATNNEFDLRLWSRKYSARFELAAALLARQAGAFIGRVVEHKHHLRCINARAHTGIQPDAATFVMDSSRSEKGRYVYHCRHAHCDGREPLLFIKQMVEAGWLSVADLSDEAFLRDGAAPRPTIRYVGGKLPSVVSEAEQALIQASLGVYQRGGVIVRPGTTVILAGSGPVSTRRIFSLGDRALVEVMTQAAMWERYDARSENWVNIDAPLPVASTYLQRTGRWRLPPLTGLIDAPTLRADGSILATPGYDTDTGLLLEPGPLGALEIPECPSLSDARAGIAVLKDLIKGFDFVADADRSVALSSFLTAVIRRSLRTAPLHAFTAPLAGSGKSKLVDITNVIATGHEAAVVAQGKTEEEFEKRLGALLLAGEQVIAIDNCEAPLGGEFLCQLLTQQVVRARILGRSEAPALPSGAMITATGNNLVLVGDMTRRALFCRLDPACERPELREFAEDPVVTALANRASYLMAALTILRAYHVAGRPKQVSPLGSFGDWSDWVRSALLWLGEADPVATMEAVRDSDPRLDAIKAVLVQWEAALGDRRVSVRELITCANEQRTVLGSSPMRMEFHRPDFREALLAIAGEGGVVNTRRLGKWIAAHEKRVVDHRRIERDTPSGGSQTWVLKTLAEGANDAR